ncbi:MAG: hypothetical protein AUH43_07565 [Acidobacteria bacterium 13_1_40CM_65_14]|nr:MAG: hypothetical protein AUH43_07565 [Acidobacteria bacterium 13_1_40CM_65_14]
MGRRSRPSTQRKTLVRESRVDLVRLARERFSLRDGATRRASNPRRSVPQFLHVCFGRRFGEQAGVLPQVNDFRRR